jgi:hypothetical protein
MSELVARTAKEFGIELTNKGVVLKPELREVLFLDTADFRFYNHAFLLRRRIQYEHGFPAGANNERIQTPLYTVAAALIFTGIAVFLAVLFRLVSPRLRRITRRKPVRYDVEQIIDSFGRSG